MADVTYTELAKCRAAKNRNVVISGCSKGGYTIAQQLRVIEDDKIISVFMKGAIVFENLEALKGLRDALNDAIDYESADEAEDWDEE